MSNQSEEICYGCYVHPSYPHTGHQRPWSSRHNMFLWLTGRWGR